MVVFSKYIAIFLWLLGASYMFVPEMLLFITLLNIVTIESKLTVECFKYFTIRRKSITTSMNTIMMIIKVEQYCSLLYYDVDTYID
jgi:hypothetical protein